LPVRSPTGVLILLPQESKNERRPYNETSGDQ
jgi:hypothetical protein